MKSLGFKLLPLARINEPSDLQARRGRQNVTDLAASIRAGVLMNPLTVTADGSGKYDLVAGGDRFAAVGLVGLSMVGCHVIQGTDEELRDATEAENLYRRPPVGRAAALSERVQQVESQQPGTVSPLTRKVKAREQVAREAGVKPATVKKAEQRTRAKDSGSGNREVPAGTISPASTQNAMPGEGVKPGTISPVPTPELGDSSGAQNTTPARGGAAGPIPIDTHGIAVTPSFVANVAAIQSALERANSLLQQAQAALAPLQSNPAWEQTRYQRLKEAAHRLAFECRSWKPYSVCVYCRMGAGQAKCNGCRGTGWLSEEAMEIVPKALLGSGATMPPPATKERKLDVQVPIEDPETHELTFEPFEDTAGEDAF